MKRPLFNRVEVGDIVQGKMTKKLYKVWLKYPEVEPHEDAIVLLDVTNTKKKIKSNIPNVNSMFGLPK